jgi:hypothetical protein
MESDYQNSEYELLFLHGTPELKCLCNICLLRVIGFLWQYDTDGCEVTFDSSNK